jgi:hypothetical protein
MVPTEPVGNGAAGQLRGDTEDRCPGECRQLVLAWQAQLQAGSLDQQAELRPQAD